MSTRSASSPFTRLTAVVIAFALLAPAGWAKAQDEAKPGGAFDVPGLTLYVSNSTRVELWDFFEPARPGGDEHYNFAGNRFRLGGTYEQEKFALEAAGQYTQLYNLPRDAAGTPGGPLGTGPIYYLHAGADETSPDAIIVKYLNFTLKDIGDSGLNFRAGRMTWANGLEANSGIPKIEALKKVRVADRVIGEFGWSFFQRSFDGGRAWWEHEDFGQLSAAWFRPTEGGFEDGGNRTMDDIDMVSSSWTLKPGKPIPGAELQLFYYMYDDDRSVTQRVDNSGMTTAPDVDILIHSYGGHLASAYDVGPGQLDFLIWGMLQKGDWYELDHDANVLAVELGYQFPKVWGKPWLRLEWLRSSGDSSASDGDHETFFQMVPTVRQYASQATYNMMNSTDLALDLILNPSPKWTFRADVHRLRLTESADRWYAGAGATQEQGSIFGLVGRSSGGDKDFGWGGQVNLIYRPSPWMTLHGFYGWIRGDNVVQNNFSRDDDLNFVFLECTLKFKAM